MPPNNIDVAPVIGPVTNLPMLTPGGKDELPAVQSFAVPQMEERKEIVVGDDVLLPSLEVGGEERELNFVPENAIADRSVNGEDGCIILFRNLRSLLEVIDGKSVNRLTLVSDWVWPPEKLRS